MTLTTLPDRWKIFEKNIFSVIYRSQIHDFFCYYTVSITSVLLSCPFLTIFLFFFLFFFSFFRIIFGCLHFFFRSVPPHCPKSFPVPIPPLGPKYLKRKFLYQRKLVQIVSMYAAFIGEEFKFCH